MKKSLFKLSLVAFSALSLNATSGQGMIQNSSESTMSLTEKPSFEAQVQRVNIGVNLVRENYLLLNNMPISSDAKWVNVITKSNYYTKYKMELMKEDPYYATINLTMALGGGGSQIISPLAVRSYYLLNVLYKNPKNPMCEEAKDKNACYKDMKKYQLPNFLELPTLDDLNTYKKFSRFQNILFKNKKGCSGEGEDITCKKGKEEYTDCSLDGKDVICKKELKIALIDVEAREGTLYNNVQEAIISLATDEDQDLINSAKAEFESANDDVAEVKGQIKAIEAKLKDEKNAKSPKRAIWEKEKKALEKDLEAKEKIAEKKQEIFFASLQKASKNIKSNFDKEKVPLAKQLEKMVDLVNDTGTGAVTMFTSATAGLIRGFGAIGNDIKVLTGAIARVNDPVLRVYLGYRFIRFMKGTILAFPSIGIGTYYANKQLSLMSEYEALVKAVLDGAKALEEKEKAKKKLEKKANK